jgi:hypothetical protein
MESMENANQLRELSPFPDFITKRVLYINAGVRAVNKIISIYEFDQPILAEVWEIILKQLDAFLDVSGFNLFAQLKMRRIIDD